MLMLMLFCWAINWRRRRVVVGTVRRFLKEQGHPFRSLLAVVGCCSLRCSVVVVRRVRLSAGARASAGCFLISLCRYSFMYY